MSAADQTHLPADLLTLFPQRQFGPDLAAARTDPLLGLQGVVDNLLRQIRAHLAPGAFGPRLLPPASFGAGGALCTGHAGGLAQTPLRVGAAFGLASERLLLQPSQLSLEIPDWLDQPAN